MPGSVRFVFLGVSRERIPQWLRALSAQEEGWFNLFRSPPRGEFAESSLWSRILDSGLGGRFAAAQFCGQL
jgi:hypothetical protein